VTYNAATNRRDGESADANGNIALAGYTYDIENRIVSVPGGTQYAYAPGNKRIWKGTTSGSTLTLDEITFWSITGQKLATYAVTGDPQRDLRLGRRFKSHTDRYREHLDIELLLRRQTDRPRRLRRLCQLGSARFVWQILSLGPRERLGHPASGEKFTGYYRDSETGLDYAQNRYHQPGMGRFNDG